MKVLWYASHWPCGQQPEYDDQMSQEKPWGKFVPFGFGASGREQEETTLLATAEGEITPAGLRSQAGREPVTGVRYILLLSEIGTRKGTFRIIQFRWE